MLTLTGAAKETGLTRSAIFKSIKSGRLSATKDDRGQFLIDPAELFRVYKQVDKAISPSEQSAIGMDTQETDKLELMMLLLKQVESERDDLRRRLDDESAERRKLTALITHQPEIVPTQTEQKAESLLWKKLFGRH